MLYAFKLKTETGKAVACGGVNIRELIGIMTGFLPSERAPPVATADLEKALRQVCDATGFSVVSSRAALDFALAEKGWAVPRADYEQSWAAYCNRSDLNAT